MHRPRKAWAMLVPGIMKRFFNIAVFAVALAAQSAHACDFPTPSIVAYARVHPHHVAFVGTVVGTTTFWQKWFGAPDASTFKVSEWYAGRTHYRYVTVSHRPAPDPSIYFCGPSRGFSARYGEKLLIVGNAAGNVIEPESPLIRSVGAEGIPVEFARELEQLRQGKLD